MLRTWEELTLNVPDPIQGADELEGDELEGDPILDGEINAYIDGVIASDQLAESAGEMTAVESGVNEAMPIEDVGAAVVAELNGTAAQTGIFDAVDGIEGELAPYVLTRDELYGDEAGAADLEGEGDDLYGDEAGAVDLEGEGEPEHPVMQEFRRSVAAVAGLMDLAGTVDGIDEFAGDQFASETTELGCCGII